MIPCNQLLAEINHDELEYLTGKVKYFQLCKILIVLTVIFLYNDNGFTN